MRCLFISTLVGIVGLLNLSATAFASTDVDVETQDGRVESNLIEDSESSSTINLLTVSLTTDEHVADIATLGSANPQNNLDHHISDSSILFQLITEFTPQDTTVRSSDSDQLSQVTPTDQTAEEQTAEGKPVPNNTASDNASDNLSDNLPDNNEIDSTRSTDLLGSGTLDQITSVTQLSDVQPTDWAYQALQSLVERYGCIVGYPDQTYRGQRALTRFEFAAGVNACLDRINELIAASTADAATQADLATLQRLQEEFAAELAQLRGRVDVLEARVSELEANQFSTTTKLSGNAIFAVADVFGENDSNQTVFQHRENISLTTSFTGRDLLLISLFAGNAPVGNLNADPPYTGTFDLPGIEISGTVGGVNRTITGTTAEGTLSSTFGATTGDTLQALTLAYSFPVGERLNIAVAQTLSPFQLYAPTLNPYLSDFESGTGAISIFGENNPIYALSGGGTGVILNYALTDSLTLTAGYLADGLAVGNPAPGNGLFNGGYGVLGQLTWRVTDNFSIAGVYTNDYAPSGRFGFNYNGVGVTGTAVANTLAGQDLLGTRIAEQRIGAIDQSPVITNGYGVQFNWQSSSRFSISGWFSTFYPRLIGEGDGNILTYALTFAFPDLGQRGNLLGLVVGAEPYLTEIGGNPQEFDVDVPLHIEAFYRHRLNDNIFITPGIIWLTAPNQSNDNPDAVIATLRTTFLF
ncbi:iron uptake porin [Leptolyngbya sp. NK1-12]|uniref:Iron uptake porin n=1 Tax=Leptolyngbya sp. NK1-12 TaxID=2547451 RepID=A0AA96WJS4_9CYAN|nr:iron uptake porin [Leptolyngbya sp. NK1-12]